MKTGCGSPPHPRLLNVRLVYSTALKTTPPGNHRKVFFRAAPITQERPLLLRPEKSVADLMRDWRRRTGLNTAEAGERLGLSGRAIEDIEQGRRRAGDVLTALALKNLIKTAK